MAVKITLSLDEETVEQLNLTAKRLRRPKSAVVRDAIRDFHINSDRTSPAEQRRLLQVLDEMIASGPTRPQSEADAEIAEIRAIRRLGGRLHPVD